MTSVLPSGMQYQHMHRLISSDIPAALLQASVNLEARLPVSQSPRPSEAESPKNSSHLQPLQSSHLETLPTELIQLILSHLPFADVLAISLTSHHLLTTTKRSDGTTTAQNTATKASCILAIADLERRHHPFSTSKLLTCTSCGKLNQNSLAGFCNTHFDANRLDRKCIECLAAEAISASGSYNVGTDCAFWCVFCKSAKLVEEAVYEGNVEKYMSRTRFHILLGQCHTAPLRWAFGRRMCRGCLEEINGGVGLVAR